MFREDKNTAKYRKVKLVNIVIIHKANALMHKGNMWTASVEKLASYIFATVFNKGHCHGQ